MVCAMYVVLCMSAVVESAPKAHLMHTECTESTESTECSLIIKCQVLLNNR